jgi:hypothetical protein
MSRVVSDNKRTLKLHRKQLKNEVNPKEEIAKEDDSEPPIEESGKSSISL